MEELLVECAKNNDFPGVVTSIGSGASVNFIDPVVSLKNSTPLSVFVSNNNHYYSREKLL
jgi:hypothetical protein